MSAQNLIIYKFNALYHILEQLGLDLNIKVAFAENENSLNECIKNSKNYLIISNKKYSDINNQLVLDNKPINIFKLVEKINIDPEDYFADMNQIKKDLVFDELSMGMCSDYLKADKH